MQSGAVEGRRGELGLGKRDQVRARGIMQRAIGQQGSSMVSPADVRVTNSLLLVSPFKG